MTESTTPPARTPRPWSLRLLPMHLVALIVVAAGSSLGVWQWQVWQDHRAATAIDPSTLAIKPLARVLGSDDPFPGVAVGQPVTTTGEWLPGSSFLVSGRQQATHGGEREAGYWVVQALVVQAGADTDRPAILVVRGWTAEQVVPPEPTGRAEIVGYLQPAEGTGDMDADPTDDVLPQIRLADVLQRVDRDLYGGYIVADARGRTHPVHNDGTAGLRPAELTALPALPGSSSLRNFLYAWEWWLFVAFAVFIWWRWLQDELASPDAGDDR